MSSLNLNYLLKALYLNIVTLEIGALIYGLSVGVIQSIALVLFEPFIFAIFVLAPEPLHMLFLFWNILPTYLYQINT